MPTVVITDHVFPSLAIEQELLGAIGATVVPLQARSEVDLLDAVVDADALLVCYAPVTDRVIGQMTRCRIIARYGIGVDNVDLGAATAKGIVVTNVPDYCVDEVSDHALALLLACARALSASRLGILPNPTRPSVWPLRRCIGAASLASHRPLRTRPASAGIRRAHASSSASAWSLTSSTQ